LQFPVSASILSLPTLNQKITEIQVDFQNEVKAKSVSSGVDEILAEKCSNQLSNLVRSADLSVDEYTSDTIGIISNHRVKLPKGYPVLDSSHLFRAEKQPLQYNFPKLKLSRGSRRRGRNTWSRVTDDRYYLVVQFKFTFDDKEYHVIL